ncbi:hypothetical protein RRG08_067000 [Elysia crispata]|uniref:TOG domain-containing protein n=1 Tax=Elysia crispata TaxID=231223 RepID=A0AAE0Z9P2_9GAST|nr:hypothetical protein RRG08_067000 [Elysia crispata]
MVDRMGEQFKPHVTTVLPAVIDRLGDSKDQVREMAQQLLLKLMMPASTPQYVFDRLGPAFHHKLWLVKEGVLVTLQRTINRYGARCLLLSKIVPDICKLLDDPSPQVRESSVNTLVEIYRHVGEKVRRDLRKGLSQQRLNQLDIKFEELKASGNMLPTADLGKEVAAVVFKNRYLGLPRVNLGRDGRRSKVLPELETSSSSSSLSLNGPFQSSLTSETISEVSKAMSDVNTSRTLATRLNRTLESSLVVRDGGIIGGISAVSRGEPGNHESSSGLVSVSALYVVKHVCEDRMIHDNVDCRGSLKSCRWWKAVAPMFKSPDDSLRDEGRWGFTAIVKFNGLWRTLQRRVGGILLDQARQLNLHSELCKPKHVLRCRGMTPSPNYGLHNPFGKRLKPESTSYTIFRQKTKTRISGGRWTVDRGYRVQFSGRSHSREEAPPVCSVLFCTTSFMVKIRLPTLLLLISVSPRRPQKDYGSNYKHLLQLAFGRIILGTKRKNMAGLDLGL